jgi:hypothetical protein
MRRRDAGPDRVQTGVRMEKRMVKVLKALAELRDQSLGELLESLVDDAFAGRLAFSEAGLVKARELMGVYDMHPAGSGAQIAGQGQGRAEP